MKRKPRLPIPAKRAMRELGENISVARRRRRIPTKIMAERAGFSVITLGKIERGEPSVSMGSYACALFVLGMTDHLQNIAGPHRDIIGLDLETENLPKRIRFPRINRENNGK